jgi:ribonuclease-3
MSESSLEKLQSALGHQFNSIFLLRQALAHRSVFSAELSYERLEFLGDRVLGLILAKHLFLEFDHDDQGKLTKRFHAQSQQSKLYEIALKIELQNHIISEKGTELATQPSIMADVIESIIAALYLDSGLEVAERFILSYWNWQGDVPQDIIHNPKSALQEWSEAQGLGLPSYELMQKTGPDHQARFTVYCS